MVKSKLIKKDSKKEFELDRTLRNKIWLSKQMEQGKSLDQISKYLKVSRNTVKRQAELFELPVRQRGRPLELTLIERKQRQSRNSKINLIKLKQRNFVQFTPKLTANDIDNLKQLKDESKLSYYAIISGLLENYKTLRSEGRQVLIPLIDRSVRVQKGFYIPNELFLEIKTYCKSLNLDFGSLISVLLELNV